MSECGKGNDRLKKGEHQMTSDTDHVWGERCGVCGHDVAETVDTQIRGRGASRTMAIRECQRCGTLWGEPREFFGVLEDYE